METKDILKKIRTDHQITQDEMAEKLAVTRQAVSRWEQGESIPNIDTLSRFLPFLMFLSIHCWEVRVN